MTQRRRDRARKDASPVGEERRPIEDFIEVASTFRDLCDNAKEHGRKRFLFELSKTLPRLQAAAAALPHVEPVSNGLPFESGERTRRSLPDVAWRYLPDDWRDVEELLRETVDGGGESLAILMLGDDVGDIYDDVTEGFDILEAGFPENDAVWHWRFGFWTHWGFHVAEAQRLIHYYVAVNALY